MIQPRITQYNQVLLVGMKSMHARYIATRKYERASDLSDRKQSFMDNLKSPAPDR